MASSHPNNLSDLLYFFTKRKNINAVYLLFVLDIFTAVQFNGFTTIIYEVKTV